MPIPVKATSPDINIADLGDSYQRADIEFEGLDHSGSSYEGRIFLNNADADAETGTTDENGYAGSFFIFGHGGCFGDEGHCDVAPRGPYDPRPPHALWPIRKIVVATEAIRRAAAAASTMSITVVPVILSTTDKVPDDEVVPKFLLMSVMTYQ
jgi:hypothetical protein